MQAEDRLIHFSTELIHKPVQHNQQKLQKLYFELSQTSEAAYASTDFSPGRPPRFYSKRGQRSQSVALFLPDRLVLIEEWVDIALSDFYDKVLVVGKRVMEDLEIPAFHTQTATLRSTFALTHFDDARVFLLDHMCAQEGRIGPCFQRPVATGGLRFVLPETPDHPGALHVLIESFKESQQEIFVEVKGIFAHANLHGDDWDQAVGNIGVTRTFITDRVFPYLNQYDVREQEEL